MPVRPIAALLVIAFLFTLVFAFPASVAAADRGLFTGSEDSNRTVQQRHIDKLKPWLDISLLVLIAVLFALLGLLKDFRRYRGLLPVIFKTFYSWVFIAFTAACIFAVDYAVFQWASSRHALEHEQAMLHLSLVLGHTGVSAAFVYVSPFLLRTIPTHAQATRAEQPPRNPEQEKPVTEMNVVYAAIQQSLETSVNGKLCDWTDEYSWPVIKSTGRMLLIDLVNSGMISHEQFESAKLEQGSYQEADEFWENRQRKYELLRKMMKHSCYSDLSSRLGRTAKIEQVRPSEAA